MVDKELQFSHLLIDAYLFFLEFYNVNPSDLNCDIVILRDISKRYFKDVNRLHKYHGISHIDAHKIAGYSTYWITKLKPVSVINLSLYEDMAEFCIYTNEIFALFVATGRLIAAYEVKSIILKKNLLDSFLYLLKYRTTSGDNLSLMYYLIDMQNQ